ncbi:MAG: metal ABC transporter ATP-binding protein [Lachnospiraceae bacterium]|nr:metal ABC transporter ATP-binding protein [Lachnospiraceae bacterium]
MALLSIQNVSLGYENHAILSGLSFTVEEGDYLAVVGENGSGKTTLMKALLGLNPPLSGEIRFGDGLKENEIGYLPQQTAIQKDFPASVFEVVLSGCQGRLGIRPFYTKADKELAREMIEKMGIGPLVKRCFSELSGGQKQRVLLARALCATKRILLLDEPTAGLDPKVTEEMYDLIDDLNRSGVTIIMISHDLEQALERADRILHIGSSVFFGTTDEYVKSGAARRFFRAEKEEDHD